MSRRQGKLLTGWGNELICDNEFLRVIAVLLEPPPKDTHWKPRGCHRRSTDILPGSTGISVPPDINISHWRIGINGSLHGDLRPQLLQGWISGCDGLESC